jgi:DNA topoisomerase VI subunit A
VRSELLQNDDFSYSLEELRTFFPKLIESEKSNILLENNPAQLDRLHKLLVEAIRQKNDLKIELIKRQISSIEFDLHSIIVNTNQESSMRSFTNSNDLDLP